MTAEPAPAESAPLLRLRDGLPPLVSTAADLAAATDRLAAGSGPVAVDAERASGYRYSQRAYLVQVRRAGTGTLLVDPLPFGDVPNEALCDLGLAVGGAEWVVHAASQDLPCLGELGLRLRRIFDTELAGRLLGYPRVNLAALVRELLGYSMRKQHSAVDWSRRPLPAPWLEYAALDVEVLVELRDALAERLTAAGKLAWAEQEFAALTRMRSVVPRAEPWRRTSGIHRVRGRRGLAIVREMWLLRDEIARRRDLAAGRVLRDDVIVATAQAAPRTRAELSAVEGFGGRSGHRYLRDFAAAATRAMRLRESELPTVIGEQQQPPPARSWPARFPAAAARLAALRAELTALSDEVEVPVENLIDPEAVRQLAWQPPAKAVPSVVRRQLEAAGARPWQVDLTAERLASALATDAATGPGRTSTLD